MTEVFLTVLKMSLSASIAALVVILARLCLRKAPKVFSYVLWAAVLFRMVCPFGIPVAVIGITDLPQFSQTSGITAPDIHAKTDSQIIGYTVDSGEMAFDQTFSDLENPYNDPERAESINGTHDTGIGERDKSTAVLGYLWILGSAVMVSYFIYTYIRLSHRLKTAVWSSENIYESDLICSAFVLGILRPRIYMPAGLSEKEKRYVIIHERMHIRRGDYLIKYISFLALSMHWFNPVIWLSYALMCGDMESSCDEAVIKTLSESGHPIENIVKQYGMTLLSLAEKNGLAAPVSFAENSVKKRVISIMAYRNRSLLFTICMAVICSLLMTACVSDPISSKTANITADIIGSYDVSSADALESRIEISFPVTLSSGNVTIGERTSNIVLCSDPVSLSEAGLTKAVSPYRMTAEDIEILNACENLTHFWLIAPTDDDLNILPSFRNLKTLDLSDWQGTDLSVLSKIKSLKSFTLRDCNCISELSVLSDCPRLRSLDINNCYEINNKSIEDISHLSKLEELYLLYEDKVDDLTPIGNISSLRYLLLSGMYHVDSIDFISNMRELEELYLYGMNMSDIGFVAPLKNLRSLDISYNYGRDENGDFVGKISDISPISGLTRLESLNLMDMDVSDISPIADLTELRFLVLEALHPDSLAPLYGLDKLRACLITNSGCTENELEKLRSELPQGCEYVTECDG